MRSLNETLARLAATRGNSAWAAGAARADRLSDLQAFGTNPGSLRARVYVPEGLQAGAALVVVLHGCTQDAAGYDHGSGWSRLADEQGFALLFPEQQRANNPNLCFNWFTSQDTRRGSGEVLSIRQMVAEMIGAHGLDPARVFVTGLSAGGAMTSVMLATYPEVFAGGAIIAGLPYGTAKTVPEALDRMRARGGPIPAALGALVTAASGHTGPWPTVSVWHGDSDTTVAPDNAALIIAQWRALHAVAAEPSTSEQVAGHRHRVWRDAAGREVIEEYRIAGLEHGTPLSTSGSQACGAVGPFMLEAGISSTRRIAAFWGLLGTEATAAAPTASEVAPFTARPARSQSEPTPEPAQERPAAPYQAGGVKRVIEDALRAAGLMR
jgi:poly(hydroxyalkanoate) depolymerase family esterase